MVEVKVGLNKILTVIGFIGGCNRKITMEDIWFSTGINKLSVQTIKKLLEEKGVIDVSKQGRTHELSLSFKGEGIYANYIELVKLIELSNIEQVKEVIPNERKIRFNH